MSNIQTGVERMPHDLSHLGFFFFQAEGGIRVGRVTGVQTCALPISMPEFWRKVTIIYSGGDDFAVYGSWDALILLAREMQRLFHRFTEENLKDFPGAEGKTISMGLALAAEAPLSKVYEE